ncbi:MAG: polysaccharide biosynthesis/export family protein, partial [Rhizobacter sp.]|nr:polysaccharide biosynthesis/export family protein [Chlorobiales bacterium]
MLLTSAAAAQSLQGGLQNGGLQGSGAGSRSALLRGYYSAFTQNQNLLDNLSATEQMQSVIALEDAVDPATYISGAGDVIEISVFGAVPLSLTATVSADGFVTVKSVGAVRASGRT